MFRIYPAYLKAPHATSHGSGQLMVSLVFTSWNQQHIHWAACFAKGPKDLKNLKSITEGKLWSAFHPNPNGNAGPKIFFAVLPLWSWATLLSSVRWARVELMTSPDRQPRRAESGSWIFELDGWMGESRSDLRGRNALYIGHIEGASTHDFKLLQLKRWGISI